MCVFKLEFPSFLDIWPGVGLQDHVVTLVLVFGIFLFVCLLFRATPAAYGSFQARGRIGAAAMQDPSHICNLHHSLWQCWILNPLTEAGDRTHILMDNSWVRYH